MAIKSYKPYTPSRRTATGSTFSDITKTKPEKSLTKPRKEKAGADEDVKTYSSKRSAAPVKADEPASEPRRASRAQAAEAAPQAERPKPAAEKAGGTARSGGRHALPEGSKSTRKSSGSYQGKH